MDEQEILQELKIAYGYEEGLEPTKLTSSLLDFAVLMAQADLGDASFSLKTSRKKVELAKAKQFLESHFSLYDVPFLKEKDLKNLNHQEVHSIEEFVLLYNGVGRDISPFRIPILYVNKSPFYGVLEPCLPLLDEPFFLKNMKVFIERIKLSQTITSITGLSYTHEIVHTQLLRERGMVKNYKNTEVLSIFLEFVYCYEGSFSLEELRRIELRRLNYFLVEFDALFKFYYENQGNTIDAIMSSKYLESIVLALRLFQLYYQSNSIVKKEILCSIQNVFAGKLCLEEMLAIYGIVFEDSLDNGILYHLLRK